VAYRAADPRGSWEGRAPISSLSLRFDDAALQTASLTAAVDPGAFNSGNFIRDANARRAVFETHLYPEATFRATALHADAGTLRPGEARDVTLKGPLTLHGVTREVSVPARVTRQGDTVHATGSFPVRLSDFQMTRPSFLGITVFDQVEVSFEVRGTLRRTE